jgi:hypothetical protein
LRKLAVEFGGEGAAGFLAVAADVVEAVDCGDVLVEDIVTDVELRHHLAKRMAGEEEFHYLEAAFAGAFFLIEWGRDGCAEFGGEGVAVGDIFLAAEDANVIVEGPDGDAQVAGDAGIGPAVEEAAEDGLALEGRARAEAADAGALAFLADFE